MPQFSKQSKLVLTKGHAALKQEGKNGSLLVDL